MSFKLYMLALLPTLVAGHSSVLEPKGSVRGIWGAAYNDPKRDSPCGAPINTANPNSLTLTRGKIVSIEWPRNNHVGGFVSLAIVPLEKSNDQSEFDKNVFQYNCFQTDCKSDQGTEEGGDPNREANTNICHGEFELPKWVPNGNHTILWTWHNGGHSRKVRNASLLTFKKCLDFKVSGNDPVESEGNKCTVFKGGDVKTKITNNLANKNQCYYFQPIGADNAAPHQLDMATGHYLFGKPTMRNECKESYNPGDDTQGKPKTTNKLEVQTSKAMDDSTDDGKPTKLHKESIKPADSNISEEKPSSSVNNRQKKSQGPDPDSENDSNANVESNNHKRCKKKIKNTY